MCSKIKAVTRFRERVYVDEGPTAVPLLSGKNLFQITPRGVKYLSRSRHDRHLEEITLEPNTVLVTCAGTVGRVQIVPEYWKGWTANQHILRLIPSASMNPGCVYAFLASDYGHLLITRLIYGSVVDEVDRDQMGSVPFPIPHDKALVDQIGDLVLEANAMREKAQRLERRAISQLETMITGTAIDR